MSALPDFYQLETFEAHDQLVPYWLHLYLHVCVSEFEIHRFGVRYELPLALGQAREGGKWAYFPLFAHVLNYPQSKRVHIHKDGANHFLMDTWSGVLFILLVNRKWDDDRTATATIPPVTHFHNILPKQIEASGNISTSQTWYLASSKHVVPYWWNQSHISVPVYVSLWECLATGGHWREHMIKTSHNNIFTYCGNFMDNVKFSICFYIMSVQT